MSLAGNVSKLCNEHLVTESGGFVKRPPLLLSLATAMGEKRAGADASGNKRIIPISPDVIDLEERINRGAREDHREMRGWSYPGTVRGLLSSYLSPVMLLPNEEWEPYLEHVTLDWCDAIEALVYPVRPRRKLSVPCPACSQVWCNDDGESRDRCITVSCWDEREKFLPEAAWDARCDGCGKEWSGREEMRFFIKALHQEAAA